MTREQQGLAFGLTGVLIFSGSMPATRAAVAGFEPLFLTAARALIAALAAGAALLLFARARPQLRDLPALALVAGCVVLAFPLLSAVALTQTASARAILFTGLLPVSTAVWAIVRGGERPQPAFWGFAGAGAGVVAGFALLTGGGTGGALSGDALMLVAVVLCGLGYAEGAVLARRLGGWQVICWALVLAAPPMMALAAWRWPATFAGVTPPAWLGLAYVALFSMLIGFVFWYRGLAIGGTAGIGQLQLLQPLAAFGLSALLLHEPVGAATVGTTLAVLACVVGARRYA